MWFRAFFFLCSVYKMIECCFYCNALFPLFCIWWGKERRCNQKLLCLCRLISGLLLLLLLLSLILLFCNFFRRLVVKGDNYPKLCFLFSKIYSRWRFLHRVNKLNLATNFLHLFRHVAILAIFGGYFGY